MTKFYGLLEEIRKMANDLKFDIDKMYSKYNEFVKKRKDLTEETFKRYCRKAVRERFNKNDTSFERNKFIKDIKNNQKVIQEKLDESEILLENIIRSKVTDVLVIDEMESILEGQKVAVLQLSDFHYGKVVDFKGDDSQLNYFDKEVAKRRISQVFFETENLLLKNDITNLCIAFMGDILSGIIHDELKYNINESIINDVWSLCIHIGKHIQKLNKIFNLEVINVSGNHGRLHKKIEFEFKATQNFDYLFGLILKNMCDDDNMVISESTSLIRNFNGKHYIFHHGDFTKGGKNISGSPAFTASRDSSFMSNKYKKMGYDNIEAIFIGHFHTHFFIPGLNVKIIGNGSLIGPDSFSTENVMISDPSQNLVIIDQEGDIEGIFQIKLKNIR